MNQIKEWVKRQATESPDSGHNRSVDGLRFLLSVAIVYFHILHSNVIPYTGEQQLYVRLQEMSDKAWLIVECFLILGGYFIYHSYRNKPERPWGDFAIGRVVRLWPVFACYTVISVVFFRQDFYDAFLDLFFLRCTGLSLINSGIVWYIGPFFWCSLLLYALLKQVSPARHGLMLGIITYLCYVMNVNCYNGSVGRSVEYGFVSMAMLRVMGGLCLGCLLEMLLHDWEEHKSNAFSWKAWTVQSAVEIGLSVFLVGYLLLGLQGSQNQLVIILAFFIGGVHSAKKQKRHRIHPAGQPDSCQTGTIFLFHLCDATDILQRLKTNTVAAV
ncbi:MAG: acyltransferase family protein [Clostridiales bacterium]|nr:acyltransferase family protein [Clostridiales bacterium]